MPSKAVSKAPAISTFPTTAPKLGGIETMPWKVTWSSIKSANPVTTAIEIKTPEKILRAAKTTIIKKPNTPSRIFGSCKLPNATKVAGFATTNPIFLKPIKAIKKPIPAPIPTRNESGIEAINQ